MNETNKIPGTNVNPSTEQQQELEKQRLIAVYTEVAGGSGLSA